MPNTERAGFNQYDFAYCVNTSKSPSEAAHKLSIIAGYNVTPACVVRRMVQYRKAGINLNPNHAK